MNLHIPRFSRLPVNMSDDMVPPDFVIDPPSSSNSEHTSEEDEQKSLRSLTDEDATENMPSRTQKKKKKEHPPTYFTCKCWKEPPLVDNWITCFICQEIICCKKCEECLFDYFGYKCEFCNKRVCKLSEKCLEIGMYKYSPLLKGKGLGRSNKLVMDGYDCNWLNSVKCICKEAIENCIEKSPNWDYCGVKECKEPTRIEWQFICPVDM